MDKLPVGQLPDLTSSNNNDEIMIITNSETSSLQKEKISDLITDFISKDENNALTKGIDDKLFVKNFGNASNITEGVLSLDVLPIIPSEKIEPTGVTADTYEYPTSVTINAQGQITGIVEGSAGANNANQDLSNLSEEGEKHFLNKSQITNCILSNSGASITKQDHTQASYVNKDCTINDSDVVYNFSPSAYVILNKTFPNSSQFQMDMWFTIEASMSGIQTLIAINDTANSIAVVDGVLRLNYMGEQLNGSTVLTSGTTYGLQFIRTDAGYTLQIKTTEAEEWTQEITLPSSLDYFSGKIVYIGSDRINYLHGSISLSSLKIEVGSGETYWDINTLLNFQTVTLSGVLDTLMPDGRKEDLTLNNLEQTVNLDTTLLLNNSTGNTKTILVKDNNEVMIRDNYTESDNEPAGAVSGDVWFDTASNQMKEQQVVLPNLINSGCNFFDGTASGFSQTKYLQLPSSYDLGSNWSIKLPVNIIENSTNDKNVIIGDFTVEDEKIIPDNLAVIYDGNETVTAYLRREDVYGVTKRTVTSTAYTVTKGDTTGYVSVEGTAESYVPASTQVYADSALTVELEVAAANTWTYTGDSTENVTTQSGFVKPSGSVFVPSDTQVYSNADLTTPLEVASGSDWIYTGTTSPSMIGALNETVSAKNTDFVGSVINTSGVLSGFSNSNYATLPKAFSPGSDSWEQVWEIKLPNTSTTQTICWASNRAACSFGVDTDKYFYLSLSSNGSSFDIGETGGNYQVQANTDYWVKISYTGSAYTLAYSLSGEPESYVTDITISSSTPIYQNSSQFFVGNNGISSNIFTGSINLNNSYIKINDEIWWQYQSGDNTLELSYNGTQYALGSQTLASTDVVRNGWQPTIGSAPSTADAYFNSTINIGNADFSFWKWNGVTEAGYSWQEFPAAKVGEVTMKSETVQPNITVNGTLTNNNGVFSGFSADNYITTQSFQPGNQPWEMVFKVTTPSSTGSGLFLSSGLNIARLNIYMFEDMHWGLSLSSNGTSWDITQNNKSSYTALTNTQYWLKLSFSGTTYSLAYSLTGEPDSYVTDITVTSSTPIFSTEVPPILGANKGQEGSAPWPGSIDLKETSFYINNELVWRWNGYTSPTAIYFLDTATIDYPVELVKKDDYISLKDLLYPIGRPVPCLNGEGLNSGEIWLEGSLENISTYPALFQVYGTTYGGDGVNTFGLPNFKGRVPWGSEDGTFGYISAGLPNITGSLDCGYTGSGLATNGTGAFTRAYNNYVGGNSPGNYQIYSVGYSFSASNANALFNGTPTVQPPAIKVRWKTRYK